MKKNSRKNAFDFYKLEFDEKNEKGIFDSAYDSWRRMTLQQREPYENLARMANPVRQKVNRLFEKRDEDYAEKAETIHEIVRSSCQNNNYETQEYYFIAANIFVKTMLNRYYPAELALIKFTLQDGIVGCFHTFVNPENIPVGYRFDAMSEANNTHRLPIPPNAKGEANYAVILEKINKFINNESEVIPLFTTEENIPMIEGIIQEFSSYAKITSTRYKVLSLDQLFFDLKAQIAIRSIQNTRGFKCIGEATNKLNQDKYMYLLYIGCQFHDENDSSSHCCLSLVKRWAYTISENLNMDLRIPLVAGNHFPIGVDLPSPTYKGELKLSDYQEYSQYQLDTTYDNNSTLGANQQDDLNSSISTNFSELEQRRRADEPSLGYSFGLLRLQVFGRGRKLGGTGQN